MLHHALRLLVPNPGDAGHSALRRPRLWPQPRLASQRAKPVRGARAGLYLLSLLLLAGNLPTRAQTAPESAMTYVRLCDTHAVCKRFSRLVMGTDHLVQSNWQHAGETEMSETGLFALLDEALRLGINTFDTSPIYVGDIERRLGKWIRSRQARIGQATSYAAANANPDRRVYVISKGGFPFDLYASGRLPAGRHSSELRQSLQIEGMLPFAADATRDQTLRAPLAGTYASRLFGDQASIVGRISEELGHSESNLLFPITVYLMHRDDADFIHFEEVSRPQTPVSTILAALSDSRLNGHYWGIGVSNWRADRIREAQQAASTHPQLKPPLIDSPYFSLFEMSNRTIHAGGVQVRHAEMMRADFQPGIRIMPYSPLGGFSLLDQPDWEAARLKAKAASEAHDPYWQNVYQALFTPENTARYARVRRFTAAFNQAHHTAYTLDQMVNAYALAHPRTDLLVIGPRTIAQLRRTVAALQLARSLRPEDLAYLHAGP